MFLTAISQLHYRPQRIVSLVPSQTELLYHLGLDAEVCGVTKFCIHPHHWLQQKKIVGGTKNIRLQLIDELKPDLVIANKEENRKEDIEYLAASYPVWVTDVFHLPSALQMISDIGNLTHRQQHAQLTISQIQQRFAELNPIATPIKTAYLIWQEPYMAAGGDTFIHAMMQYCGFNNIFTHINRYPKIDMEQLQELGCELLLLSSEPYPFKEKHITQFAQLLPNTKIVLADGEYFSWYGSRLSQAPAYFAELIKKVT